MATHPGEQKRDFPVELPVLLDPIRRALEEDQDWYRDLVEQSHDLLCVHDLEGQLLSMNPVPARLLGYSVEEMMRKPMRSFIDPHFLPQFEAYLLEIANTGESHGFLAVLTRDGKRRIWEYHNTLRREGLDRPIVRGIGHDVTERVQAARALQDSEARERARTEELETVLNAVPVPILIAHDPSGLRVTANPAGQEQFPPPEFATLSGARSLHDPGSFRMLSNGVELPPQSLPMSHVVATGEAVNGQELTILFADGSVREIVAHAVPLLDAEGHRRGAVGSFMDVTDLKRAQRELRDSEQLLREANHELREARKRLTEEKIYLEPEIDIALGYEEIIGHSKALKAVMEQVGKVAASDATVLLLGDTGTGKELVARAIHRLSLRANSSFIKMNCAAIPSGLLESELFGNERGAFTGAVSKKVGRLELADKGTLFLDEIGEISLALQPKLLRVLQDQEFERLGGTQTLRVDFRLIAATNRDLAESVRENDFRSDLYYRLNVFPVRVPRLRERREDIPLLVEHFVKKCAGRMKKNITSVPRRSMEALISWDWPGNVRELENFIERSVILTQGSVLVVPLGELQPAEAEKQLADETLAATEREHILRALRESHGQIGGLGGAAARLGLKRTTLQSKLKHLGINPRAAVH